MDYLIIISRVRLPMNVYLFYINTYINYQPYFHPAYHSMTHSDGKLYFRTTTREKKKMNDSKKNGGFDLSIFMSHKFTQRDRSVAQDEVC